MKTTVTITASVVTFLLFFVSPVYAGQYKAFNGIEINVDPLKAYEMRYTDPLQTYETESTEKGKWFSWDEGNTKLQVPLTLLYLADLGQTLYMSSNPDKYHERNCFLGRYPSKERIYATIISSYVLVTFTAYALPDRWSNMFQFSIIIGEALAVGHNFHIGIRIRY